MRGWYARAVGAAATAVICLLAIAPSAAARASGPPGPPGRARQPTTQFTINGARPGPRFDGIGAISGGGGNSRLLIEYPPAQRQQILDYLFKPGYGADLQILKIEIGGDSYATDGAEPSFEHTKGHINCAAGYEFWLAKQAKALDPGIQLYGVQWSAPGWVGGPDRKPWTPGDIHYLINWLHCANQNGLRINVLGGWNEHLPFGINEHVARWFIHLRHALDAAGYGQVQLAATDSAAHLHGHDVADFLSAHPAFRRAVSILAYHNLCRYPSTGYDCRVPAAAEASGKPIWESEVGSLKEGTALREGKGVGALTRSLINAYIEVGVSALIAWPMISSMPAYLPEQNRGLIFAEQPWSGYYQVKLMTWIIAQTTQVTRPGWRHVLGSSGRLAGGYGSFTTYMAPNRSAWSLVAQTTDARGPQTIVVHVDRGLPDSVVRVWSTNLRSHRSRSWFVRRPNARSIRRTFRYRLRPGFIYSFTTLRGVGKGRAASPRSDPMPMPYRARPDASNEPMMLEAEDGSFEYLPGGSTFEQTSVGYPVFWQNPVRSRFPYAVVGARGWRNYTVSADVRFTGAGQSAGLIARFRHPTANGIVQRFFGYQFVVGESGDWKLLRDKVGANPTVLAASRLSSPPGLGAWTNLKLAVYGSRLTASVNGRRVKSLTDRTNRVGDAGISTGGWYQVEFRNLTVTG
jgi:hypothetical protein